MGQLEGTHFTCIHTVQKGSKTNWTSTKVTFSFNVQFEYKHVLSSMSTCLHALSLSRRDWLIRYFFWCAVRVGIILLKLNRQIQIYVCTVSQDVGLHISSLVIEDINSWPEPEDALYFKIFLQIQRVQIQQTSSNWSWVLVQKCNIHNFRSNRFQKTVELF